MLASKQTRACGPRLQRAGSCRALHLVCRAEAPSSSRALADKAKQVILAGCAAGLLALGGQPAPASAAAPDVSPPELAYEQEVLVQEEKSMVQFMLQQKENAKKAQLLAERARLQTELNRVEAAIQARLNQQKANMIGAKQAGNERALQSATASVEQLEQQQQEILRAAAQLSATIDRMELLERAKSVSAKQNLDKAASQADSVINNRLNAWLEALGKAPKPAQ